MILVECAVSGGYSLKCIDLAAFLHVQAHGIFNVERTLKTGALLENVDVKVIAGVSHRPSDPPAFLFSLTPKYDKKVILHK